LNGHVIDANGRSIEPSEPHRAYLSIHELEYSEDYAFAIATGGEAPMVGDRISLETTEFGWVDLEVLSRQIAYAGELTTFNVTCSRINQERG
jgi:hypothetical protein